MPIVGIRGCPGRSIRCGPNSAIPQRPSMGESGVSRRDWKIYFKHCSSVDRLEQVLPGHRAQLDVENLSSERTTRTIQTRTIQCQDRHEHGAFER
ncbi:hypothetical protein TNCT_552321 [Trichonephila clavata]|uniref:Uncharacterized protein n=1 Tax=Trichonephila clavata TaxID=2740835 RepID=A0A8X6LY28_TRICU|nr:hypothetical protein TNCT_552321 [Trichonephila clavata]